MRINKAAGVFL